eukprot:1943614-Pyramimonas_sp.AAC.1
MRGNRATPTCPMGPLYTRHNNIHGGPARLGIKAEQGGGHPKASITLDSLRSQFAKMGSVIPGRGLLAPDTTGLSSTVSGARTRLWMNTDGVARLGSGHDSTCYETAG